MSQTIQKVEIKTYIFMKTTGIVLVILGLIMTIVTAMKFFTTEKVVDIGSIEINKEEPHKINWSPMLGFAIMGIGGLVLFSSRKKV